MTDHRHEREIDANLEAWRARPLLREIYAGFYDRILKQIDTAAVGAIVEIGSGVGNLKERLPAAIGSDLYFNSWLDLVCSGYSLPLRDAAVSSLILFDVFHHLERPVAFFREAARVLGRGGRVILFEPYISVASWIAYGVFHPEPVALSAPLDLAAEAPPDRYYAAQGNATRMFFRGESEAWASRWRIRHAEAFAAFHYLLSGGFSKPALYPRRFSGVMRSFDEQASRWPRILGGRCLIVLEPIAV
jgi:SAM-dependent methyltransferase